MSLKLIDSLCNLSLTILLKMMMNCPDPLNTGSWWALVIATVTHKSILWGNIWVQIMIIFLWTIYDLIGYLKRFRHSPGLKVVSTIICLSMLHIFQNNVVHGSYKNRSHHLKMLLPTKTWFIWSNQLQSNPVFRFDWYIFGGVFCVFCVWSSFSSELPFCSSLTLSSVAQGRVVGEG